MTTPFTDAELDHLLNFVGYGNLAAGIWFLGMEEAGGGEANLRARLGFHAVEDLAGAHRRLGVTKHHWGRKVIQRTWRGMCVVMLALAGRSVTRQTIREYQADELGRSHGDTLLAELMPIPKAKVHRWGYEALIPQLASRADYYARVKPRRVRLLRRLLAERQPRVVIAYGKGFWGDYHALFPDVALAERGPFMIGEAGDTLVVLAPHFASRAMNGRFLELAELIADTAGESPWHSPRHSLHMPIDDPRAPR